MALGRNNIPLHSQQPCAVCTHATKSVAFAVSSLNASENWDNTEEVMVISGSFEDGEQNGKFEWPLLSAGWRGRTRPNGRVGGLALAPIFLECLRTLIPIKSNLILTPSASRMPLRSQARRSRA